MKIHLQQWISEYLLCGKSKTIVPSVLRSEYLNMLYQCIKEDFKKGLKEPVGTQRDMIFFNKALKCFHRPSVISMFREVFIYQHYNPPIDLGDKPIIFDVGGNIGMYSIYASKLYNNPEIYCFEADPVTFEALGKNLKNYVNTNISTHNVALSDKTGSIQVQTNKVNINRCTHSIIDGMISDKALSNKTSQVKMELLSNYISRVEKVDFLKMDIEGSEFAVMNDLFKTGELKKVRSMVLEIHRMTYENDNIDKKYKLSEMLRQWEEFGFVFDIFAQAKRPFSLKRLNDTFMIRGANNK